jgi:hypothetical protein
MEVNMMREPNLGTMTSCHVCGKWYWCDDGWFICSRECSDKAEADLLEEKLGELECDLENLIDDYITRDITEAEFKRGWNMAIYDTEMVKDVHPDDFGPVVKRLKKEYDLKCV